jgi:HSP20 family protein
MAQTRGKGQPEDRAPQEQATGRRAEETAPARRGGRETAMSPFGEAWGWGPMTPFRRLFADFDRLFEEMQRSVFGGRGPLGAGPSPLAQTAGGFDWSPSIEIRDAGREMVVAAELPGVDPKDVQIECTDDGLVIRGETRREETREEEGVWRSERRYGSFYRQIPLPEGVDLDKAKADFRNGLLTVRLPKPETAQQRVRRIPIAGSEPRGENR